MTHRENGYKANHNEIKKQQKNGLNNNSSSYAFASNHYKYNRIKDETWGAGTKKGYKLKLGEIGKPVGRYGAQDIAKKKQIVPFTVAMKEQVFGRAEYADFTETAHK